MFYAYLCKNSFFTHDLYEEYQEQEDYTDLLRGPVIRPCFIHKTFSRCWLAITYCVDLLFAYGVFRVYGVCKHAVKGKVLLGH